MKERYDKKIQHVKGFAKMFPNDLIPLEKRGREKITRHYTLSYLRTPSSNERECANGKKCAFSFMNPEKQSAAEFLTPSEQTAFLETKVLPAQRSFCIVCSMYEKNYRDVKSTREAPTETQPFEQFNDEIDLVVSQTGCTEEEAKSTLDANNNDIVESVMKLTEKMKI
jgi:NACalpha-BTF3-like transcription factor